LKACGKNSYIGKNCFLRGNIYLGSNVILGRGTHLVSTRANLWIHDNVVFGPNITIYTGDHPTNVIGRHISELTDKEKVDPRLDQDVVVESGCWIGANALILKGVTIGRGSVIGAGSVVTKSIPPYSVYVGVPASRIVPRFEEAECEAHERILKERGMSPDSIT